MFFDVNDLMHIHIKMGKGTLISIRFKKLMANNDMLNKKNYVIKEEEKADQQ